MRWDSVQISEVDVLGCPAPGLILFKVTFPVFMALLCQSDWRLVSLYSVTSWRALAKTSPSWPAATTLPARSINTAWGMASTA